MASTFNLPLSHLLFFLLLKVIPFSSGKLLHLHFHQLHFGSDSHEVTVVNPNVTSTNFGAIAVVDDPLTEGPEATSKLVGRVQGLIVQASQETPTFLVVQNFIFSGGEYNGSTLAITCRAALTDATREYSVVGGTGELRLARGYALGKVGSSPTGTGFSIEFDVYVEPF